MALTVAELLYSAGMEWQKTENRLIEYEKLNKELIEEIERLKISREQSCRLSLQKAGERMPSSVLCDRVNDESNIVIYEFKNGDN